MSEQSDRHRLEWEQRGADEHTCAFGNVGVYDRYRAYSNVISDATKLAERDRLNAEREGSK